MYFSDLTSETPPDNKQRLNLSDHAYYIVSYDAGVFRNQAGKDAGRGEMINRIFRYSRDSADSSIAAALIKKEQYLDEVLGSDRDGCRDAKARLLEVERRKLISDSKRRLQEKRQAFSFRIDKDNMRYLGDEGMAEAEYYEDKIGSYIKAVIEEYCDKPYVEREAIYFRNHLNEIELADGKLLKIKLHTTNSGKDNIMYMKPLDVRQDGEKMYNYLVGLKAASRSGSWAPGSVRLTSIKECEALSQNAPITGKKRKELEEAIQKRGVQYLSADGTEKIVIRFTKDGIKMYNRMLHLRPSCSQKLDALTYEFDCTPFQAETYFFKFGRHAKVLESKELADKFLRKYKDAAKQYEQSE